MLHCAVESLVLIGMHANFFSPLMTLFEFLSGERHLSGLGKRSGEEVDQEPEEGGCRCQSGGDEETSGCAVPAFCI